MSLADQIVERNINSSPNQEVDEFGIPVPTPDTPQYLVARALCYDSQENDDKRSIYRLHLRGQDVYKGHTRVKECRRSILELTHLKRNIKDWEAVEFWYQLKQCLPTLNRKIIEIAEDLYWDVANAELINREQAEERSKR